MNTPVRPWRKNYRAVYGALTDPQAYEWEEFIHASVPGACLSEINEAMAALCDDKSLHKPDVRQLVRKLLMRRQGRTADMARRDAALERALQGIRDARTPRDAWQHVCSEALDHNDRADLLTHAQQTRPDLCHNGELREREKWTVSLNEIIRTVIKGLVEGPNGTAQDRNQSEQERPGNDQPPIQDRPGVQRPYGDPPPRRRTWSQSPAH